MGEGEEGELTTEFSSGKVKTPEFAEVVFAIRQDFKKALFAWEI